MSEQPTTWALDEAVGGFDALTALLDDLYQRLYADIMIGFFFLPHDRATLVAHQRDYLMAHLGTRQGRYTGRPLRAAHAHLPILPGHFDRRHRLLIQTLDDHQIRPRPHRLDRARPLGPRPCPAPGQAVARRGAGLSPGLVDSRRIEARGWGQ
jgi:truncated hemoglobin YjbI